MCLPIKMSLYLYICGPAFHQPLKIIYQQRVSYKAELAKPKIQARSISQTNGR